MSFLDIYIERLKNTDYRKSSHCGFAMSDGEVLIWCEKSGGYTVYRGDTCIEGLASMGAINYAYPKAEVIMRDGVLLQTNIKKLSEHF